MHWFPVHAWNNASCLKDKYKYNSAELREHLGWCMNKHYNQGNLLMFQICLAATPKLSSSCNVGKQHENKTLWFLSFTTGLNTDDAGHVSGCENSLTCIHRQSPEAAGLLTCPYFSRQFFYLIVLCCYFNFGMNSPLEAFNAQQFKVTGVVPAPRWLFASLRSSTWSDCISTQLVSYVLLLSK